MSNGNAPRCSTSVEPHATISAQDLVQGQPERYGFLRKRGQKERVLENLHLSRHINWRQRFVGILDGCCYCYSDELAKAPLQTFSLEGYNRIYRARSDRAAYVFTLEPATDSRKKVHFFAATTDDDRIAWMQKFKDAMIKANNVEPKPPRFTPTNQEEIYAELEMAVFERKVPTRSDSHPDNSADDGEGGESDDSDYDCLEQEELDAIKEKTQRRNLPLPPVPQKQEDHGDVTPAPAVPRHWKRALPGDEGSGEGGGVGRGSKTGGRSNPQDPRQRPAIPVPATSSSTADAASSRSPSQPSGPSGRALKPPVPSPTAGVKPVSRNQSRRLSEKESFFDNSDRDAAIDILRESNTPGTFLIRKSRQGDSKVLVVMTTEDVKEYKIFTENHRVSLDKKTFFNNVDDLLDNYNKSPLPNRQQTLSRSFSTSSSEH